MDILIFKKLLKLQLSVSRTTYFLKYRYVESCNTVAQITVSTPKQKKNKKQITIRISSKWKMMKQTRE